LPLTERMSSGAQPIGLGARQIDLVEHRNDFQPRIHRQEQIGQRLRLNPLAGVDHQNRPFARRQ
jgi:hypothetical protein